MDSPSMEKSGSLMSQTLSPCSSGRRRSSDSNSPDFEFWMVRNPSFPQTNLVSADELFVDGVLLPLHLLHLHHSEDPPDDPHPNPETIETTHNSDPLPNPETASEPGPELSAVAAPDPSTATLTASKRWRDIFKKSDRKNVNSNGNNNNSEDKEKEKEKKKERKASGGGGASSAELNINIWPFSRSRSAGNGGNRPKMAGGPAATRKVSSAPCSRSNSAGESKSRKWPSSPSRGGVHLGRSSPVWHVRRGSSGRSSEPVVVRNTEKGVQKEVNETRRKKAPASVSGGVGGGAGGGTKTRVLNLNVPMCIGYKQHLSCRSDESSAVTSVSVVAVGGGGSGSQSGGSGPSDGGRSGNLFNLRSLFTKKVY